MSSYIGKVQVGGGDQVLVGSTLYGVSTSAANATAKTVTLASFDTLMNGITVHVRFVNGNTVSSGITLAVGSASAQSVIGNCICNANDVVAFTYQEELINEGLVNEELVKTWYVNSNIVVEEGSTDGTIKVNGQAATVHGLGTAAYNNTSAFATAAQGTKADNAMPISGGTFTGAVSGPAVNDQSASGTLATVDYVRNKISGISGLTGAMHFKGITTTAVTAGGTENPTIQGTVVTTKENGDVVLYEHKEFVWTGTTWELLGDEGAYIKKSEYSEAGQLMYGTGTGTFSLLAANTTATGKVLYMASSTPSWKILGINTTGHTANAVTAVAYTANTGTWPSVSGGTGASIKGVKTAGTPTEARVTNGVLIITEGTATEAETAVTVPKLSDLAIDTTSAAWPTLNVTNTTDFLTGAEISYT